MELEKGFLAIGLRWCWRELARLREGSRAWVAVLCLLDPFHCMLPLTTLNIPNLQLVQHKMLNFFMGGVNNSI